MVRRVVLGLAALFLSAAAAGAGEEVKLFNGKDLDGWDFVLQDKNAKMEDVWSVEDGVLICKGKPNGYIRTKGDYENYVLALEWRYNPEAKRGNSGVLLHTSSPGAIGIWPKSIEAQLAMGGAGDIWVIGEKITLDNPEGRVKDRHHKRIGENVEKPAGEWNQYKITCKGDEIILEVNGQVVNHAKQCTATKGAICLQSEGALIQFRNIVLTKLD